MKYNDKNKPIIIKNTKFKKCIIFISFPIENYKDEEIMVLKRIAFSRSAEYNTSKKLYKVNINNYCLNYNGVISYLGDSPFLEFILTYPSFDSLNKDVLEDNLKFIKEIIYNPYLENGTFTEKIIEDIKDGIINKIKNSYTNAAWYYTHKNDELVDEDNYLCNPVSNNISLLDSVTSKTITDLYKNIIKNPPLVFLIGNVDENKALKSINNILLDNKTSNISFEKKYYHFCKNIPSECNMVREKTKFKTSYVAYNYKVKNMKSEKDMMLLKITKQLISGGKSRLLYKTLREKNDLVYKCGVPINIRFGLLTIESFTSKNNINLVDACYNEIMDVIDDNDFIKENFKVILEKEQLQDKLDSEKLYNILINYIDKKLEYKVHSNYDVMKSITTEDIKEFIENRLVLVSKYIGEGEE